MSQGRPIRRPRRPPSARLVDEADPTLLELIDNLLGKGVVVTGELMAGLAGVDLIYARLSALLCAADRVLPEPRRGAATRPRAESLAEQLRPGDVWAVGLARTLRPGQVVDARLRAIGPAGDAGGARGLANAAAGERGTTTTGRRRVRLTDVRSARGSPRGGEGRSGSADGARPGRRGGPGRGGTVRGGLGRGGSQRGGSGRGRSIRGGPPRYSSGRGDSVRGGSIPRGSPRDGSTRGGSLDGGAVREGSDRGGSPRARSARPRTRRWRRENRERPR